jgi:hypothetical protein
MEVAMSRSEEYHRNADECRRQSELSKHPGDREYWLKLAEEWLQMARQAEASRY